MRSPHVTSEAAEEEEEQGIENAVPPLPPAASKQVRVLTH
jgi:hypothetical protein